MSVRQEWKILLCLLFRHQWVEVKPENLAKALGISMNDHSTKYYIQHAYRYRYCCRCGRVECLKSFAGLVYDWEIFIREAAPIKFLPYDLFEDIVDEEHIILKLCNGIKWKIVRAYEWPGDMIREIRWGYQRVKRGFSDRDTWSFDDFLSNTIVNGVRHLREVKHSYPSDLMYDNEGKAFCTDEEAIKTWNTILDTIVFTFDILDKHNSSDDIFFYSEDPKMKDFVEHLKIKYPETRMLTKEEQQRYEDGWTYFKKYFQSLWD